MTPSRTMTTPRFDRRALLAGAVSVAAASTFPARRGRAADQQAVGSTGEKVMLNEAAVMDLQKSIKGPVILPSSAEYEAARKCWNPAVDHHPALIARCTSVADIQAAVQFARRHNLLTSVRCGGHGYLGNAMAEGGLAIDLKPFNGVQIDPAKKIAYVDGGALLGDLDRASMAHGLATTAGVVSHTGIGGLATGGGQGRMARKFGYTVDNFVGVEVVTPDGRLLRANEQENSDLYWAVRGGSGNFGIVTKFELKLHELDPTVTSFSFSFPLEKARDMMKVSFELGAAAALETSVGGGLRTSEKGEITGSISGTHLGSPQSLEAFLKPVRALGEPLSTRMDAIDYVKLQSAGDGGMLSERAVYNQDGFFSKIDEKLGDMMFDYLTKHGKPGADMRLSQQGGVGNKVPENAMAFPHRDVLYQFTIDVSWKDPKDADAKRQYARDAWKVFEPLSNGGFYINLRVDPNDADIARTFRGNYQRLQQIKAKYDPTNFFHLNPNIKPKAAA